MPGGTSLSLSLSLSFDTSPGYSLVMTGYHSDKDLYLKRLKRIEGQVRGIAGMIESDRYCIDVLTQVSAVTRALQGVAVGLMDEHLHHCVASSIEQGGGEGDAKISEAMDAIKLLLRS